MLAAAIVAEMIVEIAGIVVEIPTVAAMIFARDFCLDAVPVIYVIAPGAEDVVIQIGGIKPRNKSGVKMPGVFGPSQSLLLYYYLFCSFGTVQKRVIKNPGGMKMG